MSDDAATVRSYRMPDEKSQILAAIQLEGVAGVQVRTTGWGPAYYLTVGSATAAQAESVERFLCSIGLGAVRTYGDSEVA